MVAVKAMKKSKLTCSLSLSRVLTEKEILLLAKREQHPFLTGLFASFQTEHHVCFAMDYAAGGDLAKWTRNPQFDYEASM
ncbi:serine/threonine-protein kinase N2-like [Xenopus tropicalis]|uniref:non-specific serine/threonine protein kinase n=1 Tax=Xenopus tropicalis TaxID=8364 RepID=A0A8J1J7Y6_XENTR|nr:serine/threonine-protein kinase N2-like [Xenopus tropicalis]